MTQVEPTVMVDGMQVGRKPSTTYKFSSKKGGESQMFDITYDKLFQAADLLWPGKAEDILADPTDEQLAMIVACVDTLPVGVFGATWDVLPTQATTFTPL